IKRVKFNSSVASQQLMQDAVAGFLACGAYERHLRKMRNALKKQLANFLRAIAEYFPESTRVSAPKGGLCLWIELDYRIDGMELFEKAKDRNISIVPGSLCSATKNFRHCIRLNFGSPWTEKSEKGVQTLGNIILELLSNRLALYLIMRWKDFLMQGRVADETFYSWYPCAAWLPIPDTLHPSDLTTTVIPGLIRNP
ncbi:MAG: hypothetical protein ABR512_15900, partial [Desulfopila sp.]